MSSKNDTSEANGPDLEKGESRRRADRSPSGAKSKERAGKQKGEAVQPDADEAAAMSVFRAPAVRDPDPAAERLAQDETPLSASDFRCLMGLRAPSATQDGQEDENFVFKRAVKGGLYWTIYHNFQSIQYKYRVFDIATYVLLALQVVIGAIFIILGALRNAQIYVAISVLGAISTAIGGLLALMKGQGLPNRLREARNRLRNVVFEAEELYWDFRSGRPIIYSDVKKLREDYLRVMEEVRRNHPDTWTNAATEAAKAHRRHK